MSDNHGHILELRWEMARDSVSRRLNKLLEFIILSENEYQELLQLWAEHGNNDQLVADQLFSTLNGGGTATAAQLGMAIDMRNAMVAAHNAYLAFDFSAVRKMT